MQLPSFWLCRQERSFWILHKTTTVFSWAPTLARLVLEQSIRVLPVCGVYVDFLLSPPRYEDDNHIVNELWDDDEAFSINIGYQIPVFPWLRIAPIIGYSQTNWGYIDASTINLEVNDNGSIRNHHDYEIEGRDHDFNYGGALFIKPFDHIEFYGVYTLRGIYGGINVDLNWTGLFGD